LVYETSIFKHMPSENSKFAVEKAKPRSMCPVLVAILPSTQIQYFDIETKTWKPLPSMACLNAYEQNVVRCNCLRLHQRPN